MDSTTAVLPLRSLVLLLPPRKRDAPLFQHSLAEGAPRDRGRTPRPRRATPLTVD